VLVNLFAFVPGGIGIELQPKCRGQLGGGKVIGLFAGGLGGEMASPGSLAPRREVGPWRSGRAADQEAGGGSRRLGQSVLDGAGGCYFGFTFGLPPGDPGGGMTGMGNAVVGGGGLLIVESPTGGGAITP
jgi:hypothetical protein